MVGARFCFLAAPRVKRWLGRATKVLAKLLPLQLRLQQLLQLLPLLHLSMPLVLSIRPLVGPTIAQVLVLVVVVVVVVLVLVLVLVVVVVLVA